MANTKGTSVIYPQIALSIIQPKSYYLSTTYGIPVIYINYEQHPIVIEFAKATVPIGVLLDYIEDNKDSLIEYEYEINTNHRSPEYKPLQQSTIDRARATLKKYEWQTLKELK